VNGILRSFLREKESFKYPKFEVDPAVILPWNSPIHFGWQRGGSKSWVQKRPFGCASAIVSWPVDAPDQHPQDRSRPVDRKVEGEGTSSRSHPALTRWDHTEGTAPCFGTALPERGTLFDSG